MQRIVEWALILVLVGGIRWFREPRGARWTNLVLALALLGGVVLATWHASLMHHHVILSALAVGAVLGVVASTAVTMVVIPSLIALQNGAGGLAAAIVALVELVSRTQSRTTFFDQAPAVVALAVGALTFSGSLVACGKLAGVFRAAPLRLRGHNAVLAGLASVGVVAGALAALVPSAPSPACELVLAGAGVLLAVGAAIRVGGADMPVLISALNGMSGLAAALAGIVVRSSLLIACGAAVAASGFVLTAAMCRAMNRNLRHVLVGLAANDTRENGIPSTHETGSTKPAGAGMSAEQVLALGAAVVRHAEKVIVVPGYGMALAQAQFAVAQLAVRLSGMGRDVTFGIHPVAGRMPGHMYVLLAEAGTDYSRMLDIDSANDRLTRADLALVVGACDVVNPAAADTKGTPISGMPILQVHHAKAVVVCNLDAGPGYSGVPNPLYAMDKTLMLLGDAKDTVEGLLRALPAEDP